MYAKLHELEKKKNQGYYSRIVLILTHLKSGIHQFEHYYIVTQTLDIELYTHMYLYMYIQYIYIYIFNL